MKTRQFGPTKIQVPLIGQGTWNVPERGAAVGEARTALRRGIELGMVHIDTAEMYGDGKAEELISETIRGIPRELLFIVSKVLPQNASYKGTLEACEASLRRLKTDYLDCYLLHWRGSEPLSETFKAFEKLIGDGKIRSLGVSNFNVDDIKEAEALGINHPIVCNQVLYNLSERGIERRLLPYCKERSIAIVGYTPFGRSPLQTNSTDDNTILTSVAKKHRATVRQIVLAFLVREGNLFAIPKASKSAHVEENAGAGDLILDEEDLRLIDEVFPMSGKDEPLSVR